jgi:hypothetical protein
MVCMSSHSDTVSPICFIASPVSLLSPQLQLYAGPKKVFTSRNAGPYLEVHWANLDLQRFAFEHQPGLSLRFSLLETDRVT